MSSYSAEHLTADFYLWEKRGRGWDIWDYPVHLEPPFVPFGVHIENKEPDFVTDDGRKPTFLSSVVDNLKQLFGKQEDIEHAITIQFPKNILPEKQDTYGSIKELQIVVSIKDEISKEFTEHLLLSLGSSGSLISFEIIGNQNEITIQFACLEEHIATIKQQIHSFCPEANIQEGQNLQDILQNTEHAVIVDCGLSEEFMRPIKTYNHFSPDPLTTIFNSLESLKSGEVGVVQVLFQEIESPWATNIMHSVRSDDGSDFFVDAPEMVLLAVEKVKNPLFAVILRLTAQSDSDPRSWEIVRSLYTGLHSFANPISNEFIPLTNDGYDIETHLEDVIKRTSHRSGMLLNSAELLGLIHFPPSTLYSSKLKRSTGNSRSVHPVALNHDMVIGDNIHQNIIAKVSLSTEQRLRHTHIIGKTGTGKSTLLLNMAKQDMEAGRGIAILDPHGDLIEKVINVIPEDRLEDVVLFDPSDTEYPIGFNILEAHSEIEKTVLSSDLTDLFRRFSTSWGDQMTTVLSNAIAVLIENGEKRTLDDLKRFLLEKEFREDLLLQEKDSSMVYFWKNEFPLLKGSSQVSILIRLNELLRSKVIRNCVNQPKGFDFRNLIETKKIFLVKLSQGIIGEQNAYLLGSLICSKLHQVVMGRQSMQVSDRTPYFCYLDEFQHFVTPSMVSILSGSRKYAFGLVLAHQELQQLSLAQSSLMNSVISNPATRICFALGDSDASKLQDGFGHFDSSDLQNLGVGEAIVRVERKEYDFNLSIYDLPDILIDNSGENRKKIVSLSRLKYGYKAPEEVMQVHETATPQSTANPISSSMPEKLELVIRKRVISEKKTDVSFAKESATRYDTSRHRYLQTLIKKMAEQRGYRAVIEEPTPDGNGRVDVGLERNGKRIAIEISVTTGEVHEFGNIEKCLVAGYDLVIVCAPDKKNLDAIKKLALQKLSLNEQEKILFFEPDALFLFLDVEEKKELHTEQRIKGYRVKVQYQAVSVAEQNQKRDAVAQVIMKSLKRMK